MNISKKLIYVCATVLTAMLSVGCSQSNDNAPDDPGFEEGIPTEVRITLSANPNNATRAETPPDGTPKDPTSSVELIHNWWLAFISTKTGSVKVITRNDVTDKTTSTTSTVTNPNGGFEAETFRTILPTGSYRIYAFANIEPKTVDYFKDKLKVEDNKYKLKNLHLSDFIDKDKCYVEGMQWSDTENIPMTAVIERQIKNTVEEAFNIEVIRAVAKVEFEFKNPSADEITLKKLQFSPISNDPSDISIVPNYSAVGKLANEKLITDGVKTGNLSFDFETPIAVNPNYTLGFYCNESLPHGEYTQEYKDKKKPLTDLYPKPFMIDLTIDRNGKEEHKELKTTRISYINRNDWIHIPIEFNDWIVVWALHFYPPIGGYPPVFHQDGTGENITATVTTGGEFELYPVSIKRNSVNTDFSASVDWSEKMSVSVLVGSDKLFVQGKEPSVVDNPGNVTDQDPLGQNIFPKIVMGEFDPKKTGNAQVQIVFYLKDTPYTDTEFKCTFNITRQNAAPSN